MNAVAPDAHGGLAMTRRSRLCLALLLGLLAHGQPAMAFSNTLHLFSAVEGTVYLNGQPVSGVEVQQAYHWHWKNEQRTVSTRTDANGTFSLPAITGQSFTSRFLPHEPVIGQRITLRYQGREHKAWVFTRHNYDALGEVAGRELVFSCELSDEPVAHPETETFGICRLLPR